MSGRWAKTGDLVAERPEQQDVLGRVRDVVLAADDQAHLHLGVVDDDREVIERRAIAPDDHEVAAEVRYVDLDPVPDEVVPGDDALADPEAQRAAESLALAFGSLVGREVRATAHVARRLVGRLLGLAVGLELLRRAVAGVGEVLREERLGRRLVALDPRQLAVRRVRPLVPAAGDLGALIPAQAQPVQALEDVVLVGDRRADDVGVLEPQDERAAGVPGVEEVEQRRPRGADVERAGRAGRDPDAVGRHGGDSRRGRRARPGRGGRATGRPRPGGRGRAMPAGDRVSPGRGAHRASASRATPSGRGP
jgi:hypothetical protein